MNTVIRIHWIRRHRGSPLILRALSRGFCEVSQAVREALEKAFDDYTKAMIEAQKTLRRSPFYEWAGSNSDQDQAEAHQHLGRRDSRSDASGLLRKRQGVPDVSASRQPTD